MTVYEVITLLVGVILVIASFFLGGKKSAGVEVDTDAEIRKIKEAAVLHENEVRERLKNLLEQESDAAVADVQDKLSKISNDKIIAVDEYAGQVLEKIENNHQSVVFLYDMLQKKEDEMKSTMNKMEQTRRENKALFDRLEELKQAKARAAAKQAGKTPGAGKKERAQGRGKSVPGRQDAVSVQGGRVQGQKETASLQEDGADFTAEPHAQTGRKTVVRGAMPQGGQELEHTQAGALTEALLSKNVSRQTTGLEEGMEEEQVLAEFSPEPEDRQEQVLSLYREQKSVMEISKQLSMGQGEVKLIIDLYAKKSK